MRDTVFRYCALQLRLRECIIYLEYKNALYYFNTNVSGHGIALSTWPRRLLGFVAPDVGFRVPGEGRKKYDWQGEGIGVRYPSQLRRRWIPDITVGRSVTLDMSGWDTPYSRKTRCALRDVGWGIKCLNYALYLKVAEIAAAAVELSLGKQALKHIPEAGLSGKEDIPACAE